MEADANVGTLEWERPPAEPPRAFRILRGLLKFAKRKPLGAFGGVLLLLPVVSAIFIPGFHVGPLEFPRLLGQDYQHYVLGEEVFLSPSTEHYFGTDQLGRDLFSRLLVGSRTSYAIGWSVFLISSTLSITLTMISAFYIRTVDLFLQRVIEIVAYLPDLILIVAIFSIYGANPVTLVLTLGVLRGFDTSRILRATIISIKGMPYIEAARSIGAGDSRVILRHVLPQVGFLIIIQATNGLASAVVVESGLAILGFGIDPTIPTFGNLLNESRQFLRIAPWLAIFPGLTIFALLLGSRLLGDALRDVLDPRLRGSR